MQGKDDNSSHFDGVQETIKQRNIPHKGFDALDADDSMLTVASTSTEDVKNERVLHGATNLARSRSRANGET